MLTYRIDEMPEELEHWPFVGEASDYKILRGNPRASGRLDIGEADSVHRVGIWRCTAGAVGCNELGDELQTIVSSSVSELEYTKHNNYSAYAQLAATFTFPHRVLPPSVDTLPTCSSRYNGTVYSVSAL